MRKFLYIIVVLITVGGCKPKIPSTIIQPEKMAAVLYDVHMVDGYIASIPFRDSAKIVSAAYYKGIFQKFSIDSVSYNKSMDYYYDHPKVLSEMYDGITAKLKKSKDSLDKINDKLLLKEKKLAEAKAKKTKDSLEKAKPKSLIKAEALKKTKDSLDKVKAKKLADTKAAKKLKKDSLDRVKAQTKRKPDPANKVK